MHHTLSSNLKNATNFLRELKNITTPLPLETRALVPQKLTFVIVPPLTARITAFLCILLYTDFFCKSNKLQGISVKR